MTWFDKLLLVFVGCFGWSMAMRYRRENTLRMFGAMGSYGLNAASEIIQKSADAAKNKVAEIAVAGTVMLVGGGLAANHLVEIETGQSIVARAVASLAIEDSTRIFGSKPNWPDRGASLNLSANLDEPGHVVTKQGDISVTMAYNIVWASAFDYAVGNSTAALTDNGKWDGVSGTPASHVVVSASGLDFPAGMTNVLRVEQDPDWGSSRNVHVADAWPLPAVGETLYKRFYWRNGASTAGASGWDHPVQSCDGAGTKCGDAWWQLDFPGGSDWHMELRTNDTSYPHNRWRVGCGDANQAYNETYRIEWAMTRQTTTTWSLSVRIYDSAGDLAWDDDSICDAENNETITEASPTITTDDPTSQQELGVYWQDDRGSAAGEYLWFGGFAVGITDWIGAYATGEGS